MSDIVSSILGADFPKLAGVGGLFFIFLGVVPGAIKLGPVNVPRRDALGRGASLILGVMFAAVPIVGTYFGSTIGLINLGSPPPSQGIVKTGSASGIFVNPAFAADRYTVTIGQRSVLDVSQIFGGAQTNLYVGDIHLEHPSLVALYHGAASRIPVGTEISEADLRDAIPSSDIVFLSGVKQGDKQTLTVDGRGYVLSVDKVIWYLIGDDSIILSIEGVE